MSELERRVQALFAEARAWNPVDRALLDRVARRLEKRRRTPWLPVACAVAIGIAVVAPRTEPPALEGPIVASPPRRAISHRLARAERGTPARIPPARSDERLAGEARALYPSSLAPNSIDALALYPSSLAPSSLAPSSLAPSSRAPRSLEALAPPAREVPRAKPYLPRAFADFQQIDWEWLEGNRALPAYVRSIITRRDPRALLAALDHLQVDRELRLLRGELRAGASRCPDAIADFDAILGDLTLHDLHPRARKGSSECSR
jgi:hypothetical protein